MDYFNLFLASAPDLSDANTLLVIAVSTLATVVVVLARVFHVTARNHTNQLLSMQAKCETQKAEIYEAHKKERKELIEKFDKEHRDLIDNYNSMALEMTKIIERDTAAKRELTTMVNALRNDLPHRS